MKSSDFLIIGTGVAGLALALRLAGHGRVKIVTKKDYMDSNTNLAQGGIATVLDPDDSFEAHVADTLATGAGLCRPDVVDMVVREGPKRIRELAELGVPFSRDNDRLSLGLEGGHSHNRIVHCADLTGNAVERTLLQAVHDHLVLGRGRRRLGHPVEADDGVLGFITSDLHGLVERIRQAGGRVAHEPREAEGAGVLVIYVDDPDGHQLELVQPLAR